MEAGAHAWQFWIDRGGTFTDIIGAAPDGTWHTRKLLSSNPGQYEDAAVVGIRAILQLQPHEPLPADSIDAIKMGTTVATNALLEHRGEPTAWVTNAGFGDVLRIGLQNRPDVFARNIVLPQPLYRETVEIIGRIGADGTEIVPLNEEAACDALWRARQAGLKACAIALLHGYRYPAHEQRVAALARRAGFTQVSVSHQVSPVIRLVSRGDTTVVDSYLSPVLRRYVDALSEPLRGAPLWFMQSNGGLVQAALFSGKDSILSGPAGGIVGAVESCRRAGFERIISFDMGGTSTDVALYGGAYERVAATTLAGVHLRVPMLDIHTVAAGGGSIAQFMLGRYRVGPASAGADPGPACYRRGGPLTITDCNVVLGRVQPRFFPAVFGDAGGLPLDADAATRASLKVRDTMPDGERQRPLEQVAWGFLRVAVDNMSNAIKHVSLQRGHDASDYTLCCFGGAGGQHACLVADALGMDQIYVPPLAGLLSAYGMGLARVRVVEEQSVEGPLDEAGMAALQSAVRVLTDKATTRMQQQTGGASGEVQVHVFLRYAGQDTALRVDLASAPAMRAAFAAAHRQRFGFAMAQHPCALVSIQVEASARVERSAPAAAAPSTPTPAQEVRLYDGTRFVQARAYALEGLVPGMVCVGPAIISEAHATTVVEAGWQAERHVLGGLLLRRAQPRLREVVGTRADPVLLEIFNNLFMAIAERMGTVLAETAQSVNIKERLDFSCAIFDAAGQLVANAPHVPVHLGSMGDSVAAIHAAHAHTMQPGDSFATNAPYRGGTHLPDITVVTPVFDAEKTLLFYVACRGHHADVGGITPGSMPAHSQHIDEEGLLLDGFLLVERGALREEAFVEALTSGKYPARNVMQNLGDIKAQLAANAAGTGELLAMVQHYGLEVVHAYMQHVQDNAEAAVRQVIGVLQNGSFVSTMDDGSRIAVSVRINKRKRSATVDFTGSSPMRHNNLNAPRAICTAVVLYVFRTLVDAPIPLNAGCLKPLKIIVPPASMLAPVYPAAVVAGNVETSQCMADAVYGALGVLAGSQGTMNNLTFGDERLQYYETVCGGAGAGPDFHGASGVHTHMTNSCLTDAEILETRFPVRVESFALRERSGGAGAFEGGNGVRRVLRFLQPMRVSLLGNHRRVAPHGLHGGKDGARGRNTWVHANGRREIVPGITQLDVEAGDAIDIETPGGGGFGLPEAR